MKGNVSESGYGSVGYLVKTAALSSHTGLWEASDGAKRHCASGLEASIGIFGEVLSVRSALALRHIKP